MLNEFAMLKSMHFSWCKSISESVQKDKNNCMTGTVGHLNSKVGTLSGSITPHRLEGNLGKDGKVLTWWQEGLATMSMKFSWPLLSNSCGPCRPFKEIRGSIAGKELVGFSKWWASAFSCTSGFWAWGYPRGWGTWRWVCRGQKMRWLLSLMFHHSRQKLLRPHRTCQQLDLRMHLTSLFHMS